MVAEGSVFYLPEETAEAPAPSASAGRPGSPSSLSSAGHRALQRHQLEHAACGAVTCVHTEWKQRGHGGSPGRGASPSNARDVDVTFIQRIRIDFKNVLLDP